MGQGALSKNARVAHRALEGSNAERSLLPKGLREKLIVAFSLMSVVPLLVLGYVVTNYVFPHQDTAWDLTVVLGLAIIIALLGLVVARNLVLPVIKLASAAQAIAEGHLERQVDVQTPDELGTLGVALNQITQRVRDNMGQLKVYGEQTKHLNLEINRRIVTLSHLLQVSNLITQSAKVEEVRAFILEKLTQLEEAELNCLLEPAGEEGAFVVQAAVGTEPGRAQALLHTTVSAPWLRQVLQESHVHVTDGRSPVRERELLQQAFGMTNAVCQPLTSMGQGIGILVSANRTPDWTFTEDTLELLKVFAKQMAIAIENDLLAKRAEELKVIDELTGLYNASYMRSRLEEELRRAMRYHRPCSLVTFNVDDFSRFQELYGGLVAEGALRQLAGLLKAQVSEVDRVGRVGPDEFAVILPERNKREAIELAETIRQQIAQHTLADGSQPPARQGLARPARHLTVSGGVSENPIDGATADVLWTRATELMKTAKQQGKNRVAGW